MPRSTRPKSALRFLSVDEHEKPPARNAESINLDYQVPEKYSSVLDGVLTCVSKMEYTLNNVQRKVSVNKEAAREEVRRLVLELDYERTHTKKLSLTIDQKNQKIRELTQALLIEQVPPPLLLSLSLSLSRSPSLRLTRNLLTFPA